MLKDSVEMEIFYQGYSAGFSADVKFAFIEGDRPRDILKIESLYNGGGQYLIVVILKGIIYRPER
ncbi:MAG: hypothetical protein U5L96_19735 [Owenweeksia sp.]|nr:hypothetical protein [Owenweeksia sp.]